MGRNNYFQFKQFKIIQEKAAMKVNTDGVLIGAWVNLDDVHTVLDVGAGTGLISLMIAQRAEAVIKGIEIEESAAEEAVQNVQNSRWSNRVTIQNCSFQDFVQTTHNKFDLIVSNPPFFSNGIKNTNHNLSIARHNHLLPFADLAAGAGQLLSDNGKLALILPFDQTKEFVEKALQNKLFLTRLTEVKPFPGKEPNRCLMEFAQHPGNLQKMQMSVFDESGNDYSEEFKILCRAFYLKL